MKFTSFIFGFFFILTSTFGQTNRVYYRAVEGGGVKVKIDDTTELKTLIQRLENDWELEETGKGYWIGYTDLMYSIAAKKDQAIQPLVDFYNTTKVEKAKYGVLYCLHLIGIECKITGRFMEKFVNRNARNALLKFVYSDNEQIRDLAIELLMRDPWTSDVPTLMDAMQKATNDSWTIVNALIRYIPGKKPIQHEIAENLKYKMIQFKTFDDICDVKFIPSILQTIKNTLPESVLIEKDLVNKNLNGYGCSGFQSSNFEDLLKDLTNNTIFNYCDLGFKLQYYIENGTIHICSSETAKKRWLTWWNLKKEQWPKN